MVFFVERATAGMSLVHLMLTPPWRQSSGCSDTWACCVMLHHCCFYVGFAVVFFEGLASVYHHGYRFSKPLNKKERGSIFRVIIILSPKSLLWNF